MGSSWEESSFYVALRSGHCKGTCMVLDERALPLTRSWCIFELLQTFLLADVDSDFRGLLVCTEAGVLNYGAASVDTALAIAERITSLDLHNAEATVQSDKTMINQEVTARLGSFERLNELLWQRPQLVS